MGRSALRAGAIGVMAILPACQGADDSTARPGSEHAASADPAAQQDDAVDSPPVADSVAPGPERQALPLVRRAELRTPEVVPPSTEMIALLPAACADAHSVRGQLDVDTFFVDEGGFGFLVDAYVVTALESGTISIASSVEPLGDAYQYGYGYPLNAQRVEAGAELPRLSGSLVPGMSLPDNALDDGKARMDLTVEEGAQYVISFKALVGPASSGSGWRYTLGLCGDTLRVDGKLWVSRDEDDVVPGQSLSGLIDRANAEPGALGALAQSIRPR